jgi:hypothetical protein
MPTRVMGEQVAHCFEAEAAQLGAALAGDPRNFA